MRRVSEVEIALRVAEEFRKWKALVDSGQLTWDDVSKHLDEKIKKLKEAMRKREREVMIIDLKNRTVEIKEIDEEDEINETSES